MFPFAVSVQGNKAELTSLIPGHLHHISLGEHDSIKITLRSGTVERPSSLWVDVSEECLWLWLKGKLTPVPFS